MDVKAEGGAHEVRDTGISEGQRRRQRLVGIDKVAEQGAGGYAREGQEVWQGVDVFVQVRLLLSL